MGTLKVKEMGYRMVGAKKKKQFFLPKKKMGRKWGQGKNHPLSKNERYKKLKTVGAPIGNLNENKPHHPYKPSVIVDEVFNFQILTFLLKYTFGFLYHQYYGTTNLQLFISFNTDVKDHVG